MHGGNPQLTLPHNGNEVTLILFRLNKNPDGPHIIDHGPPKSLRSLLPQRIEMLSNQSAPLPIYRFVRDGAWEYLGRYRVRNITDDPRETAERSKICGRPIGYVIRLEEAG